MPESLERLQNLPAQLGLGPEPGADCRLTLEVPGAPPRQLPLHGSCYRIGRDSTSDLVLDHAVVSRRHGLLERHGRHWLLQDCASTNGLWWNGRRVRQLVLLDGDRIRLGPASEANPPELLFERQPSAPLLRLLRPLSLGLTVAAAAGVLLLTLAVQQLPIRGNLASVRGPLVLYDRQQRPVASASDGQGLPSSRSPRPSRTSHDPCPRTPM